ncbi:Styrene-oxide isomerase [Zhongshania aliphaticivorans]|uniref:Styrene-oxide isomerase n=1 Tax=Zhongshania aliphaticivorans TaxID=1470434 RepID=A0A5S9PJD0_9GAMM|nr:hypothetical protein [Zhongshania aliphaticivorans]CAA0104188.1 Styrene-oxide isomerase [Zhongshania aliphaticivorans]CAA0104356.1 Styrene-oxide isomerase [Zhongshania aliphaticivorans]
MQAYYSGRLIKQGFLALIVALVAGFLLIFSMIGGMSLSPVPILIEFDLPGSIAGWRTVHVGMLMNAIMAIAIGAAMRAVVLEESASYRVFMGTAIAIWCNFAFYIFGMFAPNRGVTLEANRLGEASLAGAAAFLPALLGSVTLIYAAIVMWRAQAKDEK